MLKFSTFLTVFCYVSCKRAYNTQKYNIICNNMFPMIVLFCLMCKNSIFYTYNLNVFVIFLYFDATFQMKDVNNLCGIKSLPSICPPYGGKLSD